MTSALEQFDQHLFLTVGGTETYLQFLQKYPLRNFCAFELIDDDAAYQRMESAYLHPIADAALEQGHGLLADALLWRASPDYLEALGYTAGDLARLNRAGVARMRRSLETRAQRLGAARAPVLVAADLGPRGDGYKTPAHESSVRAAYDYHLPQVEALAGAGADVVCALTLTNVSEAIGMALAARAGGLPLIVSPTVETDGCLPDGSTLEGFIQRVDEETAGAPLFYMVNCAHPTHLEPTLERARRSGERWLQRLRGFRANASSKSHAELDESPTLDRGSPAELAQQLKYLQSTHDLRIVGGCCGTDAEHIAALSRAIPPGASASVGSAGATRTASDPRNEPSQALKV